MGADHPRPQHQRQRGGADGGAADGAAGRERREHHQDHGRRHQVGEAGRGIDAGHPQRGRLHGVQQREHVPGVGLAVGQLADGVQRQVRHGQDLADARQVEHGISGQRLLPLHREQGGDRHGDREHQPVRRADALRPRVAHRQQHDRLQGHDRQHHVEAEPDREAERQRGRPGRHAGHRHGAQHADRVQAPGQAHGAGQRPARQHQRRRHGQHQRRLGGEHGTCRSRDRGRDHHHQHCSHDGGKVPWQHRATLPRPAAGPAGNVNAAAATIAPLC